MLHTLKNSELEEIAKAYQIDVDLFSQKIEIQDDIESFECFEQGLKLKTKTGQSLTLRFKNHLNIGGV